MALTSGLPTADTPRARPLDTPAIFAVAGAVALFLFLAAPVLRWWYWEYTRPESFYGHAFLIPGLVALMLWHRRDALRSAGVSPAPGALAPTAAALVLLVAAVKLEMQAVMSFALLLSLLGGIWCLLGARWVRAAGVPLLFLFGMAPLPGPVLNDLTLNMQDLSTSAAAGMLAVMGLHPVHLGNYIRMDDFVLNVDVPCSGFKLLLRLLTFSAAFAYLSETTLAKRWGIFLFSLPLSLAINALRIALIGLVGECLGTTAAHVFHDWSGLLTTILCMAILLGFARSLGCRRFAGQPIF